MGAIIGGGTPDTTIPEYWNGNILWFTPSEVGKEKYVTDSIRKITLEGLKNSSAKILPEKSILLSSRATVGECSINLMECCTNQGFQSFIPNKSVVSTDFLYYRLLTLKRVFIRKACGSTFLEISARQIAKESSYLPEKKEQHKIASLLSLIDERIGIQSKVIKRYESLIQAITKNLVTNGTRLFQLQDIADIYQPQTITASILSADGKYPVYGANGIIGKYNQYNHANPQICLTCRGNTCGTINYSLPYSWITGNSMVINVDKYPDRANKRYLYHLLSAINFTPFISGSGQPQIVRNSIAKMPIYLPDTPHQTKVASALDAMIEKRETEESILRLLVQRKKDFLRRMFI